MALKRINQKTKSKIDPMFYIPDGIEELEYLDTSLEEDETDLSDDDDDIDAGGVVSPTPPKKKDTKKPNKKPKKKAPKKKPVPKKKGKGEPNKNNDKLGTPKTLVIVKQTVTTRTDGSQVVDVVVDVDKIMKADKYEFRVTNKKTGKTTVIGG